MITRFPLAAAVLLASLLWGLSPKPATAQSAADERALVESAEATVARGRPDYTLLRQALAAADDSDDLRLAARANFALARADSAANRRSKAGPLFRRGERLIAEADRRDAAAALAAAQSDASEARAAEAATIAERDAVAAELAEQESAANATLFTAIAIALAITAALIFGWLASVRKLRGDVKKARAGREEAEAGFAEARQQTTGAAKASMKRLRNLLRHYRELIPPGAPGTGTSLLAAHETALSAMVKSSFDGGDTYEMATESFFEKFSAEVPKYVAANGGRLSVESMPLRLPLDQSVPFSLLVTELVAFAFASGSTVARATLTKEGDRATLTILDESGRQSGGGAEEPKLKYARKLAAALGGHMDFPTDAEGVCSRVRFEVASSGAGPTIG